MGRDGAPMAAEERVASGEPRDGFSTTERQAKEELGIALKSSGMEVDGAQDFRMEAQVPVPMSVDEPSAWSPVPTECQDGTQGAEASPFSLESLRFLRQRSRERWRWRRQYLYRQRKRRRCAQPHLKLRREIMGRREVARVLGRRARARWRILKSPMEFSGWKRT